MGVATYVPLALTGEGTVVARSVPGSVATLALTVGPTPLWVASVTGEVGNPLTVTKVIVEHPLKKECLPVIGTPNLGVNAGVTSVLTRALPTVGSRGREVVPTATGTPGPARPVARTVSH